MDMDESRVILLGLLASEDLHGYEVRRLAERRPYRQWFTPAEGDIVDLLGELVAAGLVSTAEEDVAEGRPARLLYHLAAAGRQALEDAVCAAWAGEQASGASEAGAVEAATAGVAPSAAIGEEAVACLLGALPLERAQGVLEARLAQLRGQAAQLEMEGAETVAWRALTRRRQLRIEADIQWVETLAEALEQGAFAAPPPEPDPVAPAPSCAPRRARTTRGQGAFTFVLHSHLPYCRMAGRWPHGEEWIHEAAAETYIPLLNALYDLRDEGVPYRLTLSVTPVLMEQLRDPTVRAHLLIYLDDEIRGARVDMARFGEADEPHMEYLARFYRDFYRNIRASFLDRFGGDLVGAMQVLQDEGYIEVSTSAATHGYLPLLARDSSIYGQLRTATASYRRHLGRDPRTIWLPECAYRPAYLDDGGAVRPALEEFLAPLGLTCFFAETHAVEGSEPVGKAAGEVAIGPYGAIKRRYVVPQAERIGKGGTTYAPYYVGGSGALTEPPVAVIGRNNRTGQQVWSGDLGYPGDADYREFHKKDDLSGLQYWRVTGPKVDLGDKDYYHPDWAAGKIEGHASHFCHLVEELIEGYHGRTDKYGIVSANYDTELFGHWWFEGIEWIKQVLRGLSTSERVDLTTASAYLDAHPPEEVIALPESSWGTGGTHWTWDNEQVASLWPPIHQAERRMERLVAMYPDATGDALAVLNQAARELLLLESSDWPFLVTTGQAAEYALERFHAHVERFGQMANLAEAGLGSDTPEAGALAAELEHLDNVFPNIDYRWFAARQGSAE